MKNSTTCAFCAPESNDAVYLSSKHFRVLYNLSPILPGHSLVVPKRHVESFLDLSDEELLEFVRLGRDAVRLLLDAFEVTGFNLTIQEGEEAGQTIPHLHMHLIPRKSGDLPKPGDWYPVLARSEDEVIDSAARPRLSPPQMRQVVQHLRHTAKDLGISGH